MIKFNIICSPLMYFIVKKDLETSLGSEDVTFDVSVTKQIDSQVLIAVVSASGMVIGAIISNLLMYLSNKKANKIILEGSSGWKIEVSSELKKERVDELISQVKDTSDLEKVTLVG